MKIIPVILSGGSGTRLWPLSRKEYPKQFLSLLGDNTLLQETILRLNGLKNLSNPIIVCNQYHRFLVAEQCQQIDVTNPIILLEDEGRNTAPAIAAAALQSLKISDDSVLLVLSADHIIQDIDKFYSSINVAFKHSQNGKLVIFGIVPKEANTQFGYIKPSKDCDDGAYKVKEFVEKPNLLTAQEYLDQGDYLWNSGMFLIKASTYLNANGFKNVYQLKGGILNYLQKTKKKNSLWKGECYVFDNRVSLKHNLKTGNYSICSGCRKPILNKNKRSKKYEEGVSCPNCHDSLTTSQKERFRMRQKQINLAKKLGKKHIFQKEY